MKRKIDFTAPAVPSATLASSGATHRSAATARRPTSATSHAIARSVLTLGLSAIIFTGLAGCETDSSDQSDESPTVSGACRQTTLQNCGPGPWDPFGIALSFAWYTGQCTKEVVCATEPVQTSLDDGIVTNDYIQTHWTTSVGTDTEPNDSTAEARPFVVGAHSGLIITGTVNDTSDPADFIALSFEPASYIAYLCRSVDVCTQPWLQSDEIYLELWDQNELLVQTTNMMQTTDGHAIVFLPSQDLRYFIAVRAGDTGGADFEYKLVVTD